MLRTMPPKTRFRLPPLNLGSETLGERLARLRKERGCTQVELAAKIGVIQVIVSDYERDRVRMHAEMVVRFARALGVSTDVLLGTKAPPANGNMRRMTHRFFKRLHQIEQLRPKDQRALLNTIDKYLKDAPA